MKELRDQRFGLVQTQGQYIYLHFSLFTYIDRKFFLLLMVVLGKIEKEPDAKDHRTRIRQFFASYKEYALKEAAIEKELGGRTETGKPWIRTTIVM